MIKFFKNTFETIKEHMAIARIYKQMRNDGLFVNDIFSTPTQFRVSIVDDSDSDYMRSLMGFESGEKSKERHVFVPKSQRDLTF